MPATMTLSGVVGRKEPELQQTGSGRYMCTFPLVVENARYKGQTRTGYWDVSCFGQLAEYVHKWMRSGQAVFVSGKDNSGTWEAKEVDENGSHCRIGRRFQATKVQKIRQVLEDFGDGEAEAADISAEAAAV